ncbi:MAG: hypothetical protein A2Y25_07380 [Candidatus Melainabacteria bacterium GWF2_37_15]|nr:MAG: hypothetical protein A2Y25_07380 [Candidatus Melainabacteria bacterium GWF2_37_15]
MDFKVGEFNPAYKMPAAKRLVDDVNRLDTAQKTLYVGGILPPLRRIGSLPESIKEDNWERAALLTGMAAANFPGDFTQLALAGRELKNQYANGFKNFGKKEYQRGLLFFKGTFFDSLFNKYKWYQNLKKVDTTLYSSSFGERVKSLFKIHDTNEANINKIFANADDIPAVKINGNSVQKIVGRSLLRISKFGLITTALLEIPALVKSITKTEGTITDKAKAFGTQLMKSGGYVALMTAGIAIGGAALLPYLIAGEFVGMAIGSALALMASNSLNKQIDKVVDNKNNQEKKIFPVVYT